MKSIPIEPPPAIPRQVIEACKKLSDSGFKAWLAGGCVRDLVMSREPRDWDIVTNADLEKIRELFPDHLEVGAAFGIIKLPPAHLSAEGTTKGKPVHIDIGIFRSEDDYADHRHPNVVEPGDEQTDVARRDFTVNAMYLDPATSTILDYKGGYKDISSKVIRAVGIPSQRFTEDALRILRAVRFSAQLGFKIDRETSMALKRCGGLLHKISRERIREEIFRLLASSRPVMGLEAIVQNGLWEPVFGIRKVSVPADLRQFKPTWTPLPLHWLCGLGVTGLLGDPLREPEAIAERITDLLKLSNAEKRAFTQAMRVYADSANQTNSDSSPQDWVTLAREDKPLMDILKSFIRRARGPSEKDKGQALTLVEQAVRWASRTGAESSWPTAQSLMKEGFKAGPQLGAELRSRQWQSFWKHPNSAENRNP